MSKSIEFSDPDYEAIHEAAAAQGKPVDAWVVENLPLGSDAAADVPLGPDGLPAQTMYDLFAGRIGRFNSGTGQPSSHDIGESFAQHLEEKHRKGHL